MLIFITVPYKKIEDAKMKYIYIYINRVILLAQGVPRRLQKDTKCHEPMRK
jgi:hypothetical protein